MKTKIITFTALCSALLLPTLTKATELEASEIKNTTKTFYNLYKAFKELHKEKERSPFFNTTAGSAALAFGMWLGAETARDWGFREVIDQKALEIYRQELEKFAAQEGIYLSEAELEKLTRIEGIYVRIKTFWRELIAGTISILSIGYGLSRVKELVK